MQTNFILPNYNAKTGCKAQSIALDIHGVIDADPVFFSFLSHRLTKKGWKVHVVTGGRWEHNKTKLIDWNIQFSDFFSITDYHQWKGTPITPDCKDGEICIVDTLWNSTKGQYCRSHGIDVIVDDSLVYSKYMPESTKFVWWNNFNKQLLEQELGKIY